MNELPQRKRIRLPAAAYGLPNTVCSITIAVRDRVPVFSDATLAKSAVAVLRQRARETGTLVYAFCVMPDHVHLVLSPSTGCNLIKYIQGYKDLVLREAWRQGVRGSFWQTSFWDHFLRAEEDLGQTVAYVLNNPVRRGMVESWQQYAYAGSFVFAANDLP